MIKYNKPQEQTNNGKGKHRKLANKCPKMNMKKPTEKEA